MTTMRAAVPALLDALDPTDLDVVLSRFHSRGELVDAMHECAAKVAAKLAGTGHEVTHDEYGHLAAATLTWGSEHCGVQANAGHAGTKFEWYRRFPRLAPHRLHLLNRTDRPGVIALLEATAPVVDAVFAHRPGVPQELLTIVAAAVVASEALPVGPLAVEDVAGAVVEVLDRGGELAARHRINRGPLPGAGLTVRGCADLLVLVAAYRRAIDERGGRSLPPDPLDQIDAVLHDLEGRLHRALRFAADPANRETPDEPDSFSFYSEIAEYLGNRPEIRTVADRLCTRLRRLRLTRERRSTPTDEIEDVEAAHGGHADAADRLAATPDHIARWTLAALFDGGPITDEQADHDDREVVRRWLTREPGMDLRDDVELLLGRVRNAMAVIADLPAEDSDVGAPEPEGMRRADHLHLVARLRAAITAAIREGVASPSEPVRLVSAVLPPLWTDRLSGALLLAARIRAGQNKHGNSAKVEAKLIAATIGRGPGQVIMRTGAARHGSGCAVTKIEGGVRCVERTARPPAETVVCPIRPWGEVGFVESYLTLAELTDLGTADVVRQRLRRYKGPLAHLLRTTEP